MSVVSFIVLALALGLCSMMLMYRCASDFPLHLSKGLLVSFSVAVVQVAMFCFGLLLGNVLRFELPDDPDAFARANAFVFLGVAVFVSVKMLWPYLGRRTQPVAIDLNGGVLRVLSFAVASGVNIFLFGVGAGFVVLLAGHVHAVIWPLLCSLFFFSYFGIMFGRQHVKLRPRRWMAVAALILVMVAVVAVVDA